MTEVSAQVTVILSYRSVPTGPGSRCIPPRSRSLSICSLCSRDPHSCPSRASTVQLGRGLVTLNCSRREVCVNGFSLSNPSSLLLVIQISHCARVSLCFHSVYLLIRSPSPVSVCFSPSLFPFPHSP